MSNDIKYASFTRRYIASAIDALLIGIVGGIIGALLGSDTDKSTLGSLLSLGITLFYYVGFWVKENGQTPGKKAMHIKIIRENREPINIFTGIIRYFSQYISAFALFIGYIWVIFDSRKQSWHDKIAKTYVIESDDIKPNKVFYLLALILPFIGLLGIIFSFLLVIINPGSKISKAQDTARKSAVFNISHGASIYCLEMNRCPNNLQELYQAGYLPSIPVDPKTKMNYFYELTNNGEDCLVRATLSNGELYILTCNSSSTVPSSIQP